MLPCRQTSERIWDPLYLKCRSFPNAWKTSCLSFFFSLFIFIWSYLCSYFYFYIFVFKISTMVGYICSNNQLSWMKSIIPHHWGGQMQETRWKVALLASRQRRIPASPTCVGKQPPPDFCFWKPRPEPSGPLGKCPLLCAESSSGYRPQNSAGNTSHRLCFFPQRALKRIGFARLVF